jgi:hypothetical protein
VWFTILNYDLEKEEYFEGSPRQLLEKLDKVALEYNIDIKSKHGQRYPIL